MAVFIPVNPAPIIQTSDSIFSIKAGNSMASFIVAA
jgi:hypothetical protein